MVSPMTTVRSGVVPSSRAASHIVIGLGLPRASAFLPVAASMALTMAPQPGRMPPPAVGQFGSKFVAISLAPSFTKVTAFSSISMLRLLPSPTMT